MRIRNANAGEMVTNVPPTVEALNGGEKKRGGGGPQALCWWIAQQIPFI